MFGICRFISTTIYALIGKLNLGAGYTWPGHLALKLYPTILTSPQIQFNRGLIVVSGTNGKTTTTKLISHILQGVSSKVISNTSGANLKNGVVSAILVSDVTDPDFGVFEVDEFALPNVLKDVSPTVLVLLNLSRDQLDRYGEVDTILRRWEKCLGELNEDCTVVVDETHPEIINILHAFKGTVLKFNSSLEAPSSLKGVFNAKNINATLRVGEALGIARATVLARVQTFEPAYGRGETLALADKQFHLVLAKNPASFNFNLDAILASELEFATYLFVLNANIPDGRDVSWIYDVNPEKLAEACRGKIVCVAGDRGLDMALRLKHAGVVVTNVYTNLKVALDSIEGTEVLVLPNYSAMLDVRRILVGRRIL